MLCLCCSGPASDEANSPHQSPLLPCRLSQYWGLHKQRRQQQQRAAVDPSHPSPCFAQAGCLSLRHVQWRDVIYTRDYIWARRQLHQQPGWARLGGWARCHVSSSSSSSAGWGEQHPLHRQQYSSRRRQQCSSRQQQQQQRTAAGQEQQCTQRALCQMVGRRTRVDTPGCWRWSCRRCTAAAAGGRDQGVGYLW